MNLDLIEMTFPALLQGAEITLLLAVIGVFLGFPLGVSLALARLSSNRFISKITTAYSVFFRGTPMLVQIFIVYYGLGQLQFIQNSPALWWIFGDALHCAMLTVVLNTVAFTSEIFRGAFVAVPRGAVEAALACGMSNWSTLTKIRFPLALRLGLPAYSNEVATIVKDSSLASTITVLEITGYAKRMMSETFAIVEIFAIASVFYMAINFLALFLMRCIEKRLTSGMTSTREIEI